MREAVKIVEVTRRGGGYVYTYIRTYIGGYEESPAVDIFCEQGRKLMICGEQGRTGKTELCVGMWLVAGPASGYARFTRKKGSKSNARKRLGVKY